MDPIGGSFDDSDFDDRMDDWSRNKKSQMELTRQELHSKMLTTERPPFEEKLMKLEKTPSNRNWDCLVPNSASQVNTKDIERTREEMDLLEKKFTSLGNDVKKLLENIKNKDVRAASQCKELSDRLSIEGIKKDGAVGREKTEGLIGRGGNPSDMGVEEAEQLEARFTSLAEEVERLLKRIRDRETKSEALRKGDPYTTLLPKNIFKELPGKPGFEYIKVPKKPPELCFGSKTERVVFPEGHSLQKNFSQRSKNIISSQQLSKRFKITSPKKPE